MISETINCVTREHVLNAITNEIARIVKKGRIDQDDRYSNIYDIVDCEDLREKRISYLVDLLDGVARFEREIGEAWITWLELYRDGEHWEDVFVHSVSRIKKDIWKMKNK